MPDYWLWCENTVEVDLRLFAFKCTLCLPIQKKIFKIYISLYLFSVLRPIRNTTLYSTLFNKK